MEDSLVEGNVLWGGGFGGGIYFENVLGRIVLRAVEVVGNEAW